MNQTHKLSICNLERTLKIVPADNNLKIAFLNVLGDTELIVNSCMELSKLIPNSAEVIVAPETGGIVIAHQLSVLTKIPYIIVRKKVKPNMQNPISETVKSIGSKYVQNLYLGQDEVNSINGKNVVIVDEVISSGGTLRALEQIIYKSGGVIVGRLAIATEGEQHGNVKSLCHLPVYKL